MTKPSVFIRSNCADTTASDSSYSGQQDTAETAPFVDSDPGLLPHIKTRRGAQKREILPTLTTKLCDWVRGNIDTILFVRLCPCQLGRESTARRHIASFFFHTWRSVRKFSTPALSPRHRCKGGRMRTTRREIDHRAPSFHRSSRPKNIVPIAWILSLFSQKMGPGGDHRMKRRQKNLSHLRNRIDLHILTWTPLTREILLTRNSRFTRDFPRQGLLLHKKWSVREHSVHGLTPCHHSHLRDEWGQQGRTPSFYIS